MLTFRGGTTYLGRIADFASETRGNIATTFALAIMPILFAIGAAVDYSGATDLKVRLQRGTDAAALQLCQMSRTATPAQRLQVATTALTAYMVERAYTIPTLRVTASPYQVYIETRSSFSTAVVSIMGAGFSTFDVAADAKCQAEQQTFEIALVLDNTGSMASSSGSQSKMDALKAAAVSFVNFVYATPAMSLSKISIVPFASAVAVDPTTYRNASWLDLAGKAGAHWSLIAGGKAAANAAGATNRFDAFNQLKASVSSWDWTGCLESLPYPLNTQDGAPVSSNPNSYYVPMLAADESGDGGEASHSGPGNTTVNSFNSYMDDANGIGGCGYTSDEAQRTGRPCKYMQIVNPRTNNGYLQTGPNAACTSRPLTRLTNDKIKLLTEISLQQPNGNTNIHEGLMWGWRTLSPNSVFADGAAYTKPLNNKIIILMTDGMNTWMSNANNPTLKSTYSAYGFFKNPDGSSVNTRLPPANADPSTDGQARAAMDALTLAACRNVASAPSNVQVYTIGFSVPTDPIDTQGINMLKTCAGANDRAFIANDAAGLLTVFQQIAQSIGSLRLTQ